MAKSRSSKNTQQQGSSSVNTNGFTKGMNKDVAPSFEGPQFWWHARNAANNSEDGDLGMIGNEPSNLQCGVIPYTVIGAIHRYADEWVIYSTDDINSEIGRFDDSQCKYETIVNDKCLNFNRKFLITGAAKENFDCTWQVYWDDANNPSRTLNIDNVPWNQFQVSGPEINGSDCVEYKDVVPRSLNCEKIRLAPLVDTPCIVLSKSVDSGIIANGAYQVFIAYVENEQKVTDYIGVSNIQTIWSHFGTNGSLDIEVSNLDKEYEYYELVVLRRNQGQTSAKKIGIYSVQQKNINIDFIDESLTSVNLVEIPLRSPAYEKSESMFVVNDWLIRQGPVEQFDFNYQPIANEIKVNWVTNSLSSSYYYKGGNKFNFLRDEQYAFFIRWIYNTGERSSSYHIPGRAPEQFTTPSGEQYSEDEIIYGDNVLSPNGDPLFKVYNTASVENLLANTVLPDDSLLTSSGKMGYWESTERYPNEPDIWGDLCGKPIRHHKMPSEETGPTLHLSNTGGDNINILGVQFKNIGRPKFNDGTYIPNVVGYEILRGSRLGAKSILGKGIFRNMRKYTIPNGEQLIGEEVQGLYPNYPYNDLRPDVYFHDGINNKITDGCDTFGDSITNFNPLGAGSDDDDGEPMGFSRKVFTFSSPDLMFTRPFLNAYETKLYGQVSGTANGYFKPSEDHPQFKLLRGITAFVSVIIGLGYAIRQIKGTDSTTTSSNSADISSQSGKGKSQGGGGGNVTLTTGISTAIVNLNGRSGGDWEQPEPDIIKGYIDDAKDNTNDSLDQLFNAINAQNSLAGYLGILGGINQNEIGGTGIYTPGTFDFKEYSETNIETIIPGVVTGKVVFENKDDTSTSNLPNGIKKFFGLFASQTNITIGANEIIESFYNFADFKSFMWKHNSNGLFTDFEPVSNGLWRIKNNDSNYIGSSFQTFDNGNYKINNLFRPTTVAVSLDNEISDPTTEDRSRYVIGGDVEMILNNAGEYESILVEESSDEYFLSPGKDNVRARDISAHYGALKFNFDNQYGQLSGIKQVQMRGCVQLLDDTKPDEYLYTSDPIFSGDTFVSRYTEKTIMPIYTNYLIGQPDGYVFDYSLYVNIPYPRYWINSSKYDISSLAAFFATAGLSAIVTLDLPDVPNDLYYLDRGEQSCNFLTSIGDYLNPLDDNSDPNKFFEMSYAYGYTHVNGILDFFVESDINLDQRDWEDEPKKKIYSVYENNDVDELFHAKIEKDDNFYKYDESLSTSKFPTQLSSFGEIQPLDYNPYTAESCFVNSPKRLIYSLQAQEESKRDYWRVFLNFNYRDFKNEVSVIKPINKSGAIIFFPYLSPQMFQGLDTLKTQLDTKLTIGDGGLFSQPFQNIANADISNEYGSCESLRGVINTPLGLFFISQQQGKIFQYAGQGLNPISNNGMKWWFAKYLPSKFVKQFPDAEHSVWSDNPVNGVGCHVIYDSVDDIVYFMKKDYILKSEYIADAIFTDSLSKPVSIKLLDVYTPVDIGDPLYFDECSWTVSYDSKSKAWISFHDWHPGLALPSINHFFTTNSYTDLDAPYCPTGYTYNSTNGLCELNVNETSLSEVTIDDIAATVTGGPDSCLIDIVVAMDTSGSTGSGVGSARAAQQAWLTSFLNDSNIVNLMAADQLQIGFVSWDDATVTFNMDPGAVTMSNTVTESEVKDFYDDNWLGGSTDIELGLEVANTVISDGANSTLGDRTSSPYYKSIIILVTDATTAPDSDAGIPYTSVGDGEGPSYQVVYAMFCGATSVDPPNANILDYISRSSGPVNVDPYQFGINAAFPPTFGLAADAISNSVCNDVYSCSCPTGYTLVYPDLINSTYTLSSGTCDDINPPICRKVTCECPTSTVPNIPVVESGTCPDTAPLIFQIGNPDFVQPDPRRCSYSVYISTPANFTYGGIWRHNVRCDSFANYYGNDYPWEIDLISNTGQSVNTIRSFEYQLETYVYKGDPQYNMCGGDKWEDLDFNFDESIIYNNDQVSGLLLLNKQPANEPWKNLNYPIINFNNIDILVSKVEHKFRFNQFWDITNDRGEFTNAEQPIFNTQSNGYIRPLNEINLNYQKNATQRKKFRHYSNNLILRRNVSGSRKMLLRLNNTKLLLSQR